MNRTDFAESYLCIDKEVVVKSVGPLVFVYLQHSHHALYACL